MLRPNRIAPGVVALFAASLAVLIPSALAGQDPSEARQVAVDSASPRASVLGYLTAVREGDFARAADWLDRSGTRDEARRMELARRLSALLASRLWLDLERVSPLASGDTADGLPRDREQLGTIQDGNGTPQPIRLARTVRGDSARWVFSAATVQRIDSLYEALPDHWVREHLPQWLLATGPFAISLWQWIALVILIPLGILIGWLLSAPTQALLLKLTARTDVEFDDVLVRAVRGPIVLLWAVLATRLLLRWIALASPTEAFIHDLQRAFAVAALFWIVFRAIGALQRELPMSAWARENQAMRNLVPLVGRIARVLVVVFGILAVIASFGYPIATILAGLGIGGIAVALGAQKTLEHFFGSMSIGVDQPFRVGDWVIVDGVEGEVEAIGLRSTRIRTLERTIVSIPNGRLAETRSENHSERERARFRSVFALEYDTPVAIVRRIRDELEAMLRAHAMTWQGRVVVRLLQLAPSGIEVEAFCWVETTDPDEVRRVREMHLLGIIEVVERNGAKLAYPTTTVRLEKDRQPL